MFLNMSEKTYSLDKYSVPGFNDDFRNRSFDRKKYSELGIANRPVSITLAFDTRIVGKHYKAGSVVSVTPGDARVIAQIGSLRECLRDEQIDMIDKYVKKHNLLKEAKKEETHSKHKGKNKDKPGSHDPLD